MGRNVKEDMQKVITKATMCDESNAVGSVELLGQALGHTFAADAQGVFRISGVLPTIVGNIGRKRGAREARGKVTTTRTAIGILPDFACLDPHVDRDFT